MFEKYYAWKARVSLKKIQKLEAELGKIKTAIASERRDHIEETYAPSPEETLLCGRYHDMLESLQNLRQRYQNLVQRLSPAGTTS